MSPGCGALARVSKGFTVWGLPLNDESYLQLDLSHPKAALPLAASWRQGRAKVPPEAQFCSRAVSYSPKCVCHAVSCLR